MPIKDLGANRHFQLIKRVLHHIVRVQLVDPLDNRLHIRLRRLREEQEFHATDRLKTRQPEQARLQHLDAGELCAYRRRRRRCRWVRRVGDRGRGRRLAGGRRRRVEVGCEGRGDGRRREGAGDGVHAVEGAGEDKVVVGAEAGERFVEGAVVDQAAGFVDYEERVDDPGVYQFVTWHS